MGNFLLRAIDKRNYMNRVNVE